MTAISPQINKAVSGLLLLSDFNAGRYRIIGLNYNYNFDCFSNLAALY